MQREYVEQRNEGFYVAGSRVSLASIVCEYQDGATVETILQNFPTLSLEQIHGSIDWYLEHRAEVEGYLQGLEETGGNWRRLRSLPIPSSSGGSKWRACVRLPESCDLLTVIQP